MSSKSINFLNKITSLNNRANPQTTRFFRYTLTSGLTFSLDLIFLFILTNFLGIFYLLSATIMFILANSLNYYINKKWGFKRAKQHSLKGYFYLMSINFTSLILILTFLAIAVEILSINYLLARIVIGLIIGIFSFIANSKISFKTPVFKE